MTTADDRKAYCKTLLDKHAPHAESVVLKTAWLDTNLGTMLAIADDTALYLLEFVDHKKLEGTIQRLAKKKNAAFIHSRTVVIDLIEQELKLYFAGTLKQFKTPVALLGTPFEKSVWQALQTIPYGQIWSYAQLAQAIGKPSAYRAVAQANGANNLPIIIPCHRVINTSGALGGYSGGVHRKISLLNHEKIEIEVGYLLKKISILQEIQ